MIYVFPNTRLVITGNEGTSPSRITCTYQDTHCAIGRIARLIRTLNPSQPSNVSEIYMESLFSSTDFAGLCEKTKRKHTHACRAAQVDHISLLNMPLQQYVAAMHAYRALLTENLEWYATTCFFLLSLLGGSSEN